MSGSVEAVSPAAACKRSVGAQFAARQAKAGLEELIVVSRAAALRPPAFRPQSVRLEMAPQRLEKV